MKYLVTFGLLIVASPALAWELKIVTDPITDAKRPIAVAMGEGGSIVVKCDEPGPNSVYAHFIADKYLGGSGGRSELRQLIFRFDTSPPVTSSWIYRDKGAITNRNPGATAYFTSGLRGAKRLVIRATTYDHDTVDAVIPVEGAAAFVDKVYEGCNDLVSSPNGRAPTSGGAVNSDGYRTDGPLVVPVPSAPKGD